MKTAKVRQDGQGQVVVLPRGIRFRGEEVYVKRLGTAVVLLPMTGEIDTLWMDDDDVWAYRDHHAVIAWSDENRCFVGRLVLKRDVVGFHASTRKALRTAFEKAVDDYLDAKAGNVPEVTQKMLDRAVYRVGSRPAERSPKPVVNGKPPRQSARKELSRPKRR